MAQSRRLTRTKKDIVRKLSAETGENRRETAAWVDRVFVALRDTMMSADPEIRIEIRDFGVFEVKLTKSKPKARNPRSGEIIFVPARRKTHFKPSKLLRGFLTKPLPGASGRQD
jgi:integration host factor subunit beta